MLWTEQTWAWTRVPVWIWGSHFTWYHTRMEIDLHAFQYVHWHSSLSHNWAESQSLLKIENEKQFHECAAGMKSDNEWMNDECCVFVGLLLGTFDVEISTEQNYSFPIDRSANQSAWWNDTSWLINRNAIQSNGNGFNKNMPCFSISMESTNTHKPIDDGISHGNTHAKQTAI